MEDIELFEQARRRVQEKTKGRCVRNKDVIIDQEKEIMYYRDKINKLTDKDKNKSTSNINIKIHLETNEAIQKLRELNGVIEEIKNKLTAIERIDYKQAKDYTNICEYQAGVLVKEETIQYK